MKMYFNKVKKALPWQRKLIKILPATSQVSPIENQAHRLMQYAQCATWKRSYYDSFRYIQNRIYLVVKVNLCASHDLFVATAEITTTKTTHTTSHHHVLSVFYLHWALNDVCCNWKRRNKWHTFGGLSLAIHRSF